ncbi:hypothetical protein [Arabiibacter massiliensis]|uniref:hypothetical protein n=1 Tax=Arabiibacter massiliensis TaxID=1870985 RepID=UPI001E52ECDA|nr:hypothetical protein [Arabiibacter massiliensis]
MDEARTYRLKLFDVDVAWFTLARDARTGARCMNAEVDEGKRHLLPFRMTGEPASVERWIRARTISKNRTYASRIVRQYGIHLDDPIQILDACNALSLNDAYWVVPEGSNAMFAEKNLYENDFDDLVATVAFSGIVDSSRTPTGPSGELTTSGQFPKAWRIHEGKRFLYKAGSLNTNGLEPFAELFAAQLSVALGIYHTTYDLAEWHGSLCSACPLFTSRETGFTSFAATFGVLPFEEAAAVYFGLGEEAFSLFAGMSVLDALTANDDRHLNNFGFLFDNASRRITGAAPVFDNNLALFMRDIDSGLTAADLASTAACYRGQMDVTLDYQAEYLMTADMKDRLALLRKFELTPHPVRALADEYVDLLNEYIQLRMEHLLALPTVDAADLRRKLHRMAEARTTDPFAPER